jgi:hypothetical protein
MVEMWRRQEVPISPLGLILDQISNLLPVMDIPPPPPQKFLFFQLNIKYSFSDANIFFFLISFGPRRGGGGGGGIQTSDLHFMRQGPRLIVSNAIISIS